MRTTRPRPGPPGRLRLPRRTARLRLTVLYGAAFLACGAAVLGVFAYLLYGTAKYQASPGQPNTSASASAVAHGKIPVADVQRAGKYDIVQMPVRVPIADVKQAGRYDTFTASVAPATPQQAPSLTAAEQAKLVADAQFHINYDKRAVLIVCAIVLAAIAAAAAAIGWIIAGRVLRPLSTITAAARRIAASSLHERLALHGPDDELKDLADTLDDLFARLEASFDAQQRFAANASHELRTPLTRERTLLQVTLADPGSTVATWQAVSRELLASNAEQERLIEALLALASSEGDSGQHEPLDLAAIASEALAAAGPAISRRGLNVQTAIQPAAIGGDPLLVQQLIANLIDNAVRHNVPGGDIQIATTTGDAGTVLSVINSGQVVPLAEVDRLFQPFQRYGPRRARRDGHGLGLSIVRAIATAHAATIDARPRAGGGLSIDVTFPRSPLPQTRGLRAQYAARTTDG
ncbi:MAG TPA: HAMP domain-containing sensor histidine kinase [Trebonia sp.]|jgi:signal transduction histidine kinase